MILIVGTGSNIGNRQVNLTNAKNILAITFHLVSASQIYESKAIDYTDQDDFLNQVLEFNVDYNIDPNAIMKILLDIETKMGRNRDNNIKKGPRVIDLDLLFLGTSTFKSSLVEIPHPRAFERSFVIYPLMELPAAQILKKHFSFSTTFTNSAQTKQ